VSIIKFQKEYKKVILTSNKFYSKLTNYTYNYIKDRLEANYINELLSFTFAYTKQDYLMYLHKEEQRLYLLNEGMDQNDFLLTK